MELLGNGANILLVLVGFGLLVAVHELGHFIAAKWAGVRVDSFAVGMGPVLVAYRKGIGFRFGSTDPIILKQTGKRTIELSDSEMERLEYGETEYSLRALPLGGFVRMLGQDDLNPAAASTDARSYNRVAVWKRMIIVSGGVACNIATAILLFVVAFMVGVRFEAPLVGAVMPAAPAASAGIQAGDLVVAIDNTPVSTFADLQIAAAMATPSQPLRMTIDRTVDGAHKQLTVDVTARQDPLAGVMSIGIAPAASVALVNNDEATPFLFGALTRAGFWNHAPDGMPSTQQWGVAGAQPTREEFAQSFRGATLLSVNGSAATTYDALDRAAAASAGHALATRWSIATSGDVNIALNCAPIWQILEHTTKPPSATIDYEPGFLGMSPLVRIGRVLESSSAHGTLEEGDVILRAGDATGPRQMEFRLALQQHAGRTIAMRVLRGGNEIDASPHVGRDGKLGVEIGFAWETPLIAQPFAVAGPPPGTATAVAPFNLMPLTRIDSVNGRSIGNWTDLFRATMQFLQETPASNELVVLFTPPTPSARTEPSTIVLDSARRQELSALGWRPTLGPEWFAPAEVVLTAGGDPIKAVGMGFSETKKMVLLTYLTLDRLFRGTVGVSQLRGPVGIVHIGTRVADRGMTYLLFFLAMISVNLAVINFLPIPIADGGLMVFLIYEKLRGRPPSPAFQSGAMVAGLVLVGLLFAVTFYNDVMRLVS